MREAINVLKTKISYNEWTSNTTKQAVSASTKTGVNIIKHIKEHKRLKDQRQDQEKKPERKIKKMKKSLRKVSKSGERGSERSVEATGSGEE